MRFDSYKKYSTPIAYEFDACQKVQQAIYGRPRICEFRRRAVLPLTAGIWLQNLRRHAQALGEQYSGHKAASPHHPDSDHSFIRRRNPMLNHGRSQSGEGPCLPGNWQPNHIVLSTLQRRITFNY